MGHCYNPLGRGQKSGTVSCWLKHFCMPFGLKLERQTIAFFCSEISIADPEIDCRSDDGEADGTDASLSLSDKVQLQGSVVRRQARKRICTSLQEIEKGAGEHYGKLAPRLVIQDRDKWYEPYYAEHVLT